MLYAGIDWSDQALDFELLGTDGTVLVEGCVSPDVSGMTDLFMQLEQHGQPSQIGIAIEAVRGPWVEALLARGYIVYAINPKTADYFRRAQSAAGDKSDSIDRHVLAMFLMGQHRRLHPLKPVDPDLAALRIACEDRLRLVEERTAKLNELKAALKTYYPAALGLFGDLDSRISLTFLMEFPTQREMQSLAPKSFRNWLRRNKYNRNDRLEAMMAQLVAPVLEVANHLQDAKAGHIAYLAKSVRDLNDAVRQVDAAITRRFQAMPESGWVSSLPGAGPTIAPSLLVCVGRDPQRFACTRQAQALMGTAPVTKASGRVRTVHMRQACWKFARRTLQCFADHSREKCAWAASVYEQKRQSGYGHHGALRVVANKWLKIILAMQRAGRRYEEHRFTHSRERFLLNAAGSVA